jgi:cyclic beta-1,2-glucan synthetase
MDLAPGASEEIHFVLGQGQDREDALRLADRYRSPETVEDAHRETTAFWDELLGTITVKTPDPAMDLMLNRWLLYETLSCRVWGRSALYQSSGAFGFRDQLQDVLALTHAGPNITRQHILRSARQQFPEGDVLHWWHESPDPQGGLPASRGIRTRISDNYLWLPFVVTEYVRATGDRDILDESLPYLAGEPLGPDEHERYGLYRAGDVSGSLYEHCLRAILHGNSTGVHDLPLIGAGDWNDGLNRVGDRGRGESVWLAWFRAATLRAFAGLSDSRKDKKDTEWIQNFDVEAKRLASAVETSAWDGAWYIRAFYDDGSPLGSERELECQIDAIAQSWAVLSGLGDPKRARTGMESAYKRLVDTEAQLVLLFSPPFNKTRRDPGYIKAYPPGIRENGGQYTHAAIWTAWAFAQMGNNDRANELFRMLSPVSRSDAPEKIKRYRVEPYVVVADIGGQPPHLGRGGWTWYTGSAGWLYRLGVEGILGIRREGDALRITPHLPADWDGYEARYRFGESIYRIRVEVSREQGSDATPVQASLDGKILSEAIVLLNDDGEEHQVVIRLGVQHSGKETQVDD